MKIIAVNGSPRKDWNTHILLQKALDGAASKGAQTELVHLYDIDYKGCIACLACKRKDAPPKPVRCVVKDGLTPILERIASSDALILGSPIYFGEVTSGMRAFLERFLFQYLSYDKERVPLAPKKIPSAFIYTMGVPEAALDEVGYKVKFAFYKNLLESILGRSETLVVTETLQVKDYGKFNMRMFDEDQRKKRREAVFPKDCEAAFNIGASLSVL